MPEEVTTLPSTYIIRVPGVIHATSRAISAPQALAQALYAAFQTRNRFRFDDRLYEGEVGIRSLIEALINHPGFGEFVQELPGMASKPVRIPLPAAPEGAPMATASCDVDAVAELLLKKGQDAPLSVARVVDEAPEDADALIHVLLNAKTQSEASMVVRADKPEAMPWPEPPRPAPTRIVRDPHRMRFWWLTPRRPKREVEIQSAAEPTPSGAPPKPYTSDTPLELES